MTRDDVLFRLAAARSVFDAKVAFVPPGELWARIPGSGHSTLDIVAHVSAFESLVVERLIAARHGAQTMLPPDKLGRDAFERTTWRETDGRTREQVLGRADEVHAALKREVGALSNAELENPVGAMAAIDRSWLRGRAPWQAILADTAEHYREHFEELDLAARQGKGAAAVT